MPKRRRERDRPKAAHDAPYNSNKRVLLSYASDDEAEDVMEDRSTSIKPTPMVEAVETIVGEAIVPNRESSSPDSVHRKLFEEAWRGDDSEEVEEETTTKQDAVFLRATRKNDATGQWAALGSLAYQWDEEDVEEEDYNPDEEDAMEYLRAVRSERQGMPLVFKAPNSYSNEEIYENGEGDARGWYEDGAYVARPDSPTELPQDEKTNIEPQEAFTQALKRRFVKQRLEMHRHPEQDAVTALDHNHPISFPESSKKARLEWHRLITETVPLAAQVQAVQQIEVFRLLDLIHTDLLLRENDVSFNTSAWIWSLLARLDEVGTMNNNEVWTIRELGRKAVLVQLSFSDSSAAEQLESVAATEKSDPASATNLPALLADEQNAQSANTTAISATSSEANLASVESASDASQKRQNTLATLDMIITLAGEIFGQRDLLEFRQPWNDVQNNRPDLSSYEELYKHFHANPELSNQEKETAATIVSHLKDKISSDFDIRNGIGGTGIAAILQNGDGSKILLRADFDALPVQERTGLPYASKKRMIDSDGVEKPVMHACGHDMHITSLLAAAETLHKCKDSWAGTLILAFQPAEERGTGAQAMVDDGMYDPKRHNVPIPDLALGGHVMPFRSGVIGTRKGLVATAADSMRITLHGRGGHASMPDRLIDPVVMAASTIMKLQTIVSREVDSWDSAVVTVASIQAGDAENVVVDDARIAVDVRTIDPKTREKVKKSIHRIVNAESVASNAVAEPTFQTTRAFPLTVNDEAVTEKLEETFKAHFKEDKHNYTTEIPKLGGSEDFSILATAVDRPYSFFMYGGTDPEVWDKFEAEGTLSENIPINHSGLFYPVIQPTLKTAVDAYAIGALTWLAKR